MIKRMSVELQTAVCLVNQKIDSLLKLLDSVFCSKNSRLPEIREKLCREQKTNLHFLQEALDLLREIDEMDGAAVRFSSERCAILFQETAQTAERNARETVSALKEIRSAHWLWKGKKLNSFADDYQHEVRALCAVLLLQSNTLFRYTGGPVQAPKQSRDCASAGSSEIPVMAPGVCCQAQNVRPSLSSFFSGKKRQSLKVSSVQFSAVAPENVMPGKYLPLNILMYEEAFRGVVEELLVSYKEGAKESRSGFHDVQNGSEVSVRLSSPDVPLADEEETQIWSGKYLNFEFAVLVPEDYSRGQMLFTASVYINGIIATKLKLILDCETRKEKVSVTREDITSAFVSYASQDRSRVAAIIQGMKKARPDMDIFFDIESLRSGQRWEDTLRSEIACRDVLFLCWSRSARNSQWVDMEWRYALQLKGEDAIEPIPIDPPDICPPPAELTQKHFNDRMLYIIKSTEVSNTGVLCLRRIKTGEMMPLEQESVRIGKDSSADFLVTGNATISRRHAAIIRHGERFFIVDTGSANHTYVDGEMIPSNVEVPVGVGSSIRLANELFEIVRA